MELKRFRSKSFRLKTIMSETEINSTSFSYDGSDFTFNFHYDDETLYIVVLKRAEAEMLHRRIGIFLKDTSEKCHD